MKDISVVICCYNSQSRIRETLRHIAYQEIDSLKCEVILVNNNCTDNTVSFAQSVWNNFLTQIELRIIHEMKPGLSNARKSGVISALGKVIVFCDDDNWLGKDYLKIAYQIMNTNSNIGILGGQSRAVSDIEIPNWFYTYYQYYACGILALESGDITHRTWIWGAGMVLRRKLLLTLYSCFNHITIDRNGNDFSSGGDVEICYWHILAGYKLWYSEDLKLEHYMPPSRLRINLAQKQMTAQKNSAKLLSRMHQLVQYYVQFKNYKNFIILLFSHLYHLNFGKLLEVLKYYLILSRLLPNKTIGSVRSFKRKLVTT